MKKRNKILTMIGGFFRYQFLLEELIVRDIKVRYRKSVLGLLWTILNPLMMMAIMTVVFSRFFRSSIENFPVYFFCGNLLFAFNAESTVQAQGSIISNGSLFKKVYIPKYLFPLSRTISSLINTGFALIALIIVMLLTHTPFHPSILLTPLLIFYLFCFSAGLGMLISTMTVFFRDLTHFYGVIILAWTYMTPIFYPISILPDKVQQLMAFNPMYQFIHYFRIIVLEGQVPNLQTNLICLSTGLAMLLIGLFVFYKKQDKFILFI